MSQRRFARLTNGFSKKLTNYTAAVSQYVAHYDRCRVHEALRTTPGVAQGIADRVSGHTPEVIVLIPLCECPTK